MAGDGQLLKCMGLKCGDHHGSMGESHRGERAVFVVGNHATVTIHHFKADDEAGALEEA